MSPSTPQHSRTKMRVAPPTQLTGHLGWISVILVLALAGAGINLYRYLNPASPQITEKSAIAQPADAEHAWQGIDLDDPPRPRLPSDDPGKQAMESLRADPPSATGERPLNSPPDEEIVDSAPKTQSVISEGRRLALAELTKPSAPPTAQPVTETPSTPSPPVPQQAREIVLQAPLGPEPPETTTPPNVIPPPAALEPSPQPN